MDKKSIIKLAIKFITDEISDEECQIVLNFSEKELELFSMLVKSFSPKRA